MNKLEKKNKKIVKKEAFKGKKTYTDPFGRVTTRKNAEVGHIVPKSKGGSDAQKNLQVLSKKSYKEKGEKLTGTSNNKAFRVNKINSTMKVTDKEIIEK